VQRREEEGGCAHLGEEHFVGGGLGHAGPRRRLKVARARWAGAYNTRPLLSST